MCEEEEPTRVLTSVSRTSAKRSQRSEMRDIHDVQEILQDDYVHAWASEEALSEYWTVITKIPHDTTRGSLTSLIARKTAIGFELEKVRYMKEVLNSTVIQKAAETTAIRQNVLERRRILESVHSKVMQNMVTLRNAWKSMKPRYATEVAKSRDDLDFVLQRRKKCVDIAQNVAHQLLVTQTKRKRLLQSIPEKFKDLHNSIEQQFTALQTETQTKISGLLSQTIALNDDQVANWIAHSLLKVEETKKLIQEQINALEAGNKRSDELIHKLTESNNKIAEDIATTKRQIQEIETAHTKAINTPAMGVSTEEAIIRHKKMIKDLEKEIASKDFVLNIFQCPIECIPSSLGLTEQEKKLGLARRRLRFLNSRQTPIERSTVFLEELASDAEKQQIPLATTPQLIEILTEMKNPDPIFIKAISVIISKELGDTHELSQQMLAASPTLTEQYRDWFSLEKRVSNRPRCIYDGRVHVNEFADAIMACEPDVFVVHASHIVLCLIHSIQPQELIHIKDHAGAELQSIASLRRYSANLSAYVKMSILKHDACSHRAAMLERWIQVGTTAIEQSSFPIAFCVATALADPAVTGLTQTWSLVRDSFRERKERLMVLTDGSHDFAAYEHVLTKADARLTVPEIEVVMKRLEKAEKEVSSENIHEEKAWNMKKFRAIAQEIEKVMRPWGVRLLFRLNRIFEARIKTILDTPSTVEEIESLAQRRRYDECSGT